MVGITLPQDKQRVLFPPFPYAHVLDEPAGGFDDYREQLVKQGWAATQAISEDKAKEYRHRMLGWLEGFGRGFDRNDKATFKREHLPVDVRGGMIFGYSLPHEDFLWEMRTEPGVIEAFARIWGTDELITSFDAASIMMPHRTDVLETTPWPHVDCHPHRTGFYCVQGLLNLNDNEEDDGGLMVMTGSQAFTEQFFKEHEGKYEYRTEGHLDWHMFSDADLDWFEARGCKWEKLCPKPGELVLWDSRTIHQNARPSGDRDRVCAYICMAPADLLSEEDRATRIRAFDTFTGTTHVPFSALFVREHKPQIRAETGLPDEQDTGKPRNPPKVTQQILKLVGKERY